MDFTVTMAPQSQSDRRKSRSTSSDRLATTAMQASETTTAPITPRSIAFPSTSSNSAMVHLEESVRILAPIDRCFDLARSVEVHLLGNVHFGEQAVASAGVTSGLVALGETVTWRAKHFGVWFTLTSEITAMDAPLHFRDEMRQGPFRFMRHDHYFQPLPGDATDMTDIFRFAAPLPLLGLLAEA